MQTSNKFQHLISARTFGIKNCCISRSHVQSRPGFFFYIFYFVVCLAWRMACSCKQRSPQNRMFYRHRAPFITMMNVMVGMLCSGDILTLVFGSDPRSISHSLSLWSPPKELSCVFYEIHTWNLMPSISDFVFCLGESIFGVIKCWRKEKIFLWSEMMPRCSSMARSSSSQPRRVHSEACRMLPWLWLLFGSPRLNESLWYLRSRYFN